MGAANVATKRIDGLPNRQGGMQGTMGMILVGDWRAEERHHSVPKDLVDRAFVTVYALEEHLESAVHDGVDVLGVELFGRIETTHVNEEHGHQFPLALQRA